MPSAMTGAPAPRLGVLVLNAISAGGLSRLPAESYRVGKDVADPDAILVRSADMHSMTVAASVRAVGRAGAGTNNIPVAALSARGMVQLKGHRSVGGMRASIYNAMPLAGVRALADFMRDFERHHG